MSSGNLIYIYTNPIININQQDVDENIEKKQEKTTGAIKTNQQDADEKREKKLEYGEVIKQKRTKRMLLNN